MVTRTIEGAMLGDSLGKEIVGVNLAEPLTDDTFNEIESVFRHNPVLVFRNQSLEAPAYARFARRFGDIRPGVMTSISTRKPQRSHTSRTSVRTARSTSSA